jgi:hypothetical protein
LLAFLTEESREKYALGRRSRSEGASSRLSLVVSATSRIIRAVRILRVVRILGIARILVIVVTVCWTSR